MERSSTRLKVLALLVAMMFAALSTRLWFLQVLAANQARRAAADNSVRIVQTSAQRGLILDDRGRPLVQNRRSIEVLVNRQQMAANPEAEVLRLSKLLGVPAARISAALQTNRYYVYQPVPIAVDVSKDVALAIGERQSDFPGVSWQLASVRQYPLGDLAAHIFGTVGPITKDQLGQKAFATYSPTDIVGQSGLESTYDRWLQGTKGTQKYLVDAAGNNKRLLGEEPPLPGDDVKLYLDEHIQRIVEDSLSQGLVKARGIVDTGTGLPLKANAGAVVVLDPHTGGVVAMASLPTFNPSWFVGGLTKKQERYLFNSKTAPLYDRAVQASYAPGSAFKPFIALSALHDGVANVGQSYDCPAQYSYPTDPSHPFRNWAFPASFGFISISTALKISCDTVFYQFGAAYYRKYIANPYGSGALPLQRDLRSFGFGHVPGVDLPSQGAGLIPTPTWKAAYAKQNPQLFNRGEQVWLPADDILMSIGQGYVAVTPLQLAAAYAAIANGGRLCQPRLAEQIQTPSGDVVRKIHDGACRKLPYTAAEIDYVRNSLQQVTKSGGTAGFAFAGFPFDQVAVGGKTGTAQRPPFQDTSWFAALVGPVNNPDYVIVATVEQGGHGSTTAAPIVRSIIEQMYHLGSSGFRGGSVQD